MLWPTQPLAVIEVSVGSPVALVVALAANLLLFSLIGLLAGATATRRGRLIALLAMVLVLTALFALWGAGFNWRYVGVVGLGCAVLLQVLLFTVTARLGQRWSDAP
jgi:hypothetical protein